MIPTPEQVVPLLVPAIPDLRNALRRGIDFADDLQPDPTRRDPWFWSHSARWKACSILNGVEHEGWAVTPDVPNCGIHLRLGDLHVARVLRSLAGTTPHPGSNRRRVAAWQGVQGQLPLAENGTLPPLSLVVDWHEAEDGEPAIHVGLPAGSWTYGTNPRLHWRVLVPEDGLDLSSLRFDPGPDVGDTLVTLAIDPAEEGKA
jgi:hypothetical protein